MQWVQRTQRICSGDLRLQAQPLRPTLSELEAELALEQALPPEKPEQPSSRLPAAAAGSTTAEVEQLRAQIRQLELDVVSAALATNDDEMDELKRASAALLHQLA